MNKNVIGQLTSGITSKITPLDFTLMHWGANVRFACNSRRTATALHLAIVDVKVLSGLANEKNRQASKTP